MGYDVFISHSTKDKEVGDAVCAALEASGIQCWIAPRDIKPGEVWATSILHGITQSRIMVLVLSAHANKSKHVGREVERADTRGTPILTLRIADVMPQDALEYFLSDSQWLDALTPPLQQHLPTFVELVRAVLSPLGNRAQPLSLDKGLEAITAGAPRASEEQYFRALFVQSVAEIVEAADRLSLPTDGASQLPAHMAQTIPRFERAAEYVAKYTVLNTLPARQEALNAAFRELTAIQTALANAGRTKDFLFPAANDWRALLEADWAKVKADIEAAQPIPNKFVFGNPIWETEFNLFTGRRDLVRQIEQNLLGNAQAPMLLLYGARRMGKSTILNQLPRMLGPDFAPALVDCQSPACTESAATVLLYFSEAISGGLRRRRVEVDPLPIAALANAPYSVFDGWLRRTLSAMPRSMRIMFCLDEYERLQSTLDAGWGGTMLDFLRHLIQHQSRVVLMFTGVRTFAKMGPAWTDRFISAKRVRVSLLKREEVIPLLTRPVPEFNMSYGLGALESLINRTNGQPFLTQAVASELVELLNDQQRHEASPVDVDEAVNRAMESGGEYLANVWSDAGTTGQAFLKELATGERPSDSHEAAATLLENDVITAAGDFAVPLVRDWVRREKLGRS